MDSKRDHDTVNGVMEQLTSVNFATIKLCNLQNKKAVQGCRDTSKENLRKFRKIKDTSQAVRNDMTNAELRRLSLRNSARFERQWSNAQM